MYITKCFKFRRERSHRSYSYCRACSYYISAKDKNIVKNAIEDWLLSKGYWRKHDQNKKQHWGQNWQKLILIPVLWICSFECSHAVCGRIGCHLTFHFFSFFVFVFTSQDLKSKIEYKNKMTAFYLFLVTVSLKQAKCVFMEEASYCTWEWIKLFLM